LISFFVRNRIPVSLVEPARFLRPNGSIGMPEDLSKLAEDVLQHAREAGLAIVTAESCTAGLMCRYLADAEGAATYFYGGFVTYTKVQKSRALAVPSSLLREEGAVSGAVARAMAEGALMHSNADISAAITGVAGPEPDEDGNPVGRVCIAVARRHAAAVDFERQYGDIGREEIRERAIADALRALAQLASSLRAAA
jgi:nicotinamide-nucleotide amidase